jgi:NodT family efflux transporter outer membrane factor (OMF) lipoprotein
MNRGIPFIATAVLALLSGCATAGPDYVRPTDRVADSPAAEGSFVSGTGEAFSQAELPEKWWHLYNDPRLDALVEQSLAANADLRVADANLARAAAVVAEVEAGRSIATDLSGGTTLSRPSGTAGSLPGTVGYDLGLSAGYPLDLRGKIRRAIEASMADREAVEAARDSVRVSVAAATAKAYVQVCAANYALSVNQRVVNLQNATLDATRRLQRGGRATTFDVSRAQTAVATSAAVLPVYAAQRQAGLYLLATLQGKAPADFPADAASCAALPDLSAPMPVGDGAALVRRRPDIRAAERAIAADTARIGVAAADLYPQISLGGSVGVSGPAKSIGSTSSFGFSLGPLISWSFPNRQIVRARIAQAGAQVDADLAQFDSTVLGALRDTETALETYARDLDRAEALRKARESAVLSAAQAGKLYRFGRSDFLTLLDAQRSLAQAEVSYVDARNTLTADQVAIFLALGGGWS